MLRNGEYVLNVLLKCEQIVEQ